MTPGTRALAESALSAWGVALDAAQWALLDNYVADVLEYGRKVNLTAAADETEIVRRHLLDALAPLPDLRSRLGPAPRLADVGAGAGFLGIGLKIAWPEAEVTLIESSYRKFRFLSLAGAKTGLRGLHVLHERAGSQCGFDCVLARAVAPLAALVGLALPLGRRLTVWQSSPPDPKGAALERALQTAGGSFEAAFSYRLPGEDRDRWIVHLRRRTENLEAE